MKTVNAMPFDRCNSCPKCILSVSEQVSDTNEKILLVKCKNEHRCKEDKADGSES
jgi:flavoprotein